MGGWLLRFALSRQSNQFGGQAFVRIPQGTTPTLLSCLVSVELGLPLTED